LTVNAISGYSGGGKGLMELFETKEHEPWSGYGYALVSFLYMRSIFDTLQPTDIKTDSSYILLFVSS
jgi:N-acetyl-gamma-glutamylphosphate reductase